MTRHSWFYFTWPNSLSTAWHVPTIPCRREMRVAMDLNDSIDGVTATGVYEYTSRQSRNYQTIAHNKISSTLPNMTEQRAHASTRNGRWTSTDTEKDPRTIWSGEANKLQDGTSPRITRLGESVHPQRTSPLSRKNEEGQTCNFDETNMRQLKT